MASHAMSNQTKTTRKTHTQKQSEKVEKKIARFFPHRYHYKTTTAIIAKRKHKKKRKRGTCNTCLLYIAAGVL